MICVFVFPGGARLRLEITCDTDEAQCQAIKQVEEKLGVAFLYDEEKA